MLDKAKELLRVQKFQSEIKKKLESLTAFEQKGDNSVVVNGDKKIKSITVNGKENKELRDLINAAMKNMDSKIQKEMRDKEEEFRKIYGL